MADDTVDLTTNVEYLRTHGPTPRAELPGQLMIPDRQQGATVFKLSTLSRGGDASSKMNARSVAYLYDQHDKATVAHCWLEANDEYFQEYTRRTILASVGRSAGGEWVDAFRTALDTKGGDDANDEH